MFPGVRTQTQTRQSLITLRPHCALPGRYHLQWTQQQQNDPFCSMMLLAIEWSLLQRMRYTALSMGKKMVQNCPSPWDFVTLPEEDQATSIGNAHGKIGKDRTCGSGDILADRRRHRHTQLITILRHCSVSPRAKEQECFQFFFAKWVYQPWNIFVGWLIIAKMLLLQHNQHFYLDKSTRRIKEAVHIRKEGWQSLNRDEESYVKSETLA